MKNLANCVFLTRDYETGIVPIVNTMYQEGTFHQVRQAKRSADLFMRELSSRLEVRQRRRRFFPMDYLF